LIRGALVASEFGFHFPEGYIYVALALTGAADGLNMLTRRRLNQPPK
jgi:hypothetical protein